MHFNSRENEILDFMKSRKLDCLDSGKLCFHDRAITDNWVRGVTRLSSGLKAATQAADEKAAEEAAKQKAAMEAVKQKQEAVKQIQQDATEQQDEFLGFREAFTEKARDLKLATPRKVKAPRGVVHKLPDYGAIHHETEKCRHLRTDV